jgi:glycosyltransferase involved in cell wall biosynthesis
MRRLEILHVLGTADVAGSAISGMVEVLARELDPGEFRVSACFLGASGPWTTRLRAAGVDTSEVHWPLPQHIDGAWRFWRELRRRRVDVLHVHFGGRSVRRLCRWATGAPVVVHAHGRVRNETEHAPVPLDFGDADAVVATSQAVAELVIAPRVHVAYPGVTIRSAAAGREPLLIGAAGRLEPIKGYDVLLEAFAAVLAEYPGARLELAGEGAARADLERQVGRLAIGHAVRFLGWIELAPVMARWSVFVQPSREEGLGVAALEAMANGLPVIASAVGGLPELVQNGVTGLLIPPDAAPALAEAIAALLHDPARARAYGDAGQRAAAGFSDRRFADEIAAVYRALAGRNRVEPGSA